MRTTSPSNMILAPRRVGGRIARGLTHAGLPCLSEDQGKALRAPGLAIALVSSCGVHPATAVSRDAAPPGPCASFPAASSCHTLPGVTPVPLHARRLLGLSRNVLLHVACQPSPSALAAHRTPPRWPAARCRPEGQEPDIETHFAGRKSVTHDP